MKARYFLLLLWSVFLIGGCSDSNPSKTDGKDTVPAANTALNQLRVEPEKFSGRFNACMEKLGKNFRIEEIPRINDGPNQNTFQSNPTHQITIIGTVDKKTGLVINAMLVARGNDQQGMENIIVHATGMAAGYKSDVVPSEAKKEITRMVAAYNPHKDEPISTTYKGLKLTYGMQADMGLSYFSVRPAQ